MQQMGLNAVDERYRDVQQPRYVGAHTPFAAESGGGEGQVIYVSEEERRNLIGRLEALRPVRRRTAARDGYGRLIPRGLENLQGSVGLKRSQSHDSSCKLLCRSRGSPKPRMRVHARQRLNNHIRQNPSAHVQAIRHGDPSSPRHAVGFHSAQIMVDREYAARQTSAHARPGEAELRVDNGYSTHRNGRCSPTVFAGNGRGLSDIEAAMEVKDWVGQQGRQGRHLKGLDALLNESVSESTDLKHLLWRILRAADSAFFSNTLTTNDKLSAKVDWKWSTHPHYARDPRYTVELLGTTTPRYLPGNVVDAQIVLSAPLLLSGQFNTNLLFSTFLHELIHAYLFISCGKRAEKEDGHPEGFRVIASLIDECTGGTLRLRSLRADLEQFRVRIPEISPNYGSDAHFDACIYVHSAYHRPRINLTTEPRQPLGSWASDGTRSPQVRYIGPVSVELERSGTSIGCC